MVSSVWPRFSPTFSSAGLSVIMLESSQLIYTRVVRPFFLQHEAAIDSVVKDLSGKGFTLLASVKEKWVPEDPSAPILRPRSRVENLNTAFGSERYRNTKQISLLVV
ncbi:uncharacterized protein gng7 isoform X1 [Tachysurus fulvidraco]|uniref:uncharacterized protein gng7 isoform X1 n=1 Tax=Tachysurus fulvidraco TaxID=1234273 RepID=UPI001FEDC48C|nr:uncharacterized protein gng7 isoform X1 [Tachysurus fulvidraco]XP_047671229.1 uncharacterized protein gng7 isoform X1 [Tachysurus fulvidraco]XP_047671232.1 uncharacterized protein gng7 isoform X1 [Tachysurus fulvidraco]XP_047671236.1 uncharacterized protein gng7 isoform X1 [Tachysurus fulvidraco]